MKKTPVLIIHGGAGTRSKNEKRCERMRQTLRKILDKAYEILLEKSALEGVVEAVRLMEDDPDFNAGTGSRLQADGAARLSASLMDGAAERFAAVINIEEIKNPILVARKLLPEEFRVLAGREALAWALKNGFKAEDPRTPESIARWKAWREKGSDTVGAAALDSRGCLASATSTGGRGFETPGRVSDSGMPVANYADSSSAISATGTGEHIMDHGLSVRIATRVRDGLSLKAAFQKTFEAVREKKRSMGAVAVDKKGAISWETSTEVLIYAWRRGNKNGIF